ncbi:MAG: hypothetical protein CL709_02220 [Chloroflexi bacterium]|nr:hypothetical protein [Chloroflexota bacterium]
MDGDLAFQPMIEASVIAKTIKPHSPTDGMGTAPVDAFNAVEVALSSTKFFAVTDKIVMAIDFNRAQP